VRFRAFRRGPWKLVETSEAKAYLFRVGEDGGESRDLAAEQPETLAALRAELAEAAARIGLPALDGPLDAGAGAEALDPATRERLKELGYVE
jgi:arylsulfatase A-like enzyme